MTQASCGGHSLRKLDSGSRRGETIARMPIAEPDLDALDATVGDGNTTLHTLRQKPPRWMAQ
jgi:hypothetical protein